MDYVIPEFTIFGTTFFFEKKKALCLRKLFTGNSRLTCFQNDCTIIHLFVFFSVCVFRYLSSGKETAPVCATSMAFLRMFERSVNRQISAAAASFRLFHKLQSKSDKSQSTKTPEDEQLVDDVSEGK